MICVIVPVSNRALHHLEPHSLTLGTLNLRRMMHFNLRPIYCETWTPTTLLMEDYVVSRKGLDPAHKRKMSGKICTFVRVVVFKCVFYIWRRFRFLSLCSFGVRWEKSVEGFGVMTQSKVHPRTEQKGPEGRRHIALLFLWMGCVVNTTPRPLYPRERPGIQGGLQSRLGRVRKISPGFDPQTVQLVASRYTDWAILAPVWRLWQGKIEIVGENLSECHIVHEMRATSVSVL